MSSDTPDRTARKRTASARNHQAGHGVDSRPVDAVVSVRGLPPAIEVRDLDKFYFMPSQRLEVLKGLNLTVSPGEMIAVVGQSGCGKSTLLHILGALDRPTSGSVRFGSLDLQDLDAEGLAEFRRASVGFIFQLHNLLPEFSALENVSMPQRIAGTYRDDHTGKEMLALVGLEKRIHHRPGELSGGEQQRVAIARALVNRPQLVLADEPTGNLDIRTGTRVFELFREIQRDKKHTSILVTHNARIAAKCDRILKLENGSLRAASGTHV